MSDTPGDSPARRYATVILPFVVVGLVVWALVALTSRKAGDATASGGKSVAGAEPPTFASVAAGMLGSSVMRGIIANSQRKAIEQELGGILTELKFSASQRERFFAVLLEQQSVVMEASLKRMAGNLSAEESAKLQRTIDDANDGVLAKSEAFFAREFPGEPAKFGEFQRYTALAPDRIEVANLQKRLMAAKLALTPAQERGLTDVMHEVREGVVPALDPEDLSLTVLSAETLARRIRDQQRIDALLRTKAAAVLDPAQVAILAEHQADRLKALQAIVDQATPTAPASK